jgi:hypothetical protein
MVSTEAEDEAAGDRGRSRLQHKSKSPRADDARVRVDSRKPGGRRAEDRAHRRTRRRLRAQAETAVGGRRPGDGRERKETRAPGARAGRTATRG